MSGYEWRDIKGRTCSRIEEYDLILEDLQDYLHPRLPARWAPEYNPNISCRNGIMSGMIECKDAPRNNYRIQVFDDKIQIIWLFRRGSRNNPKPTFYLADPKYREKILARIKKEWYG